MTALTPSYKLLLATLKNRIQQARTRAALAVSKELLHLYWLIGRDIVLQQEQEGWGKAAVEQIAHDLVSEHPGIQGFSASNLWRMRAFYLAYADSANLAQVVRDSEDPPMPDSITVLPWGHHITLIEKVKEYNIRLWYAQSALQHGWSRAVLTHQIESRLFDRQGQAITNFQQTMPPPQSDLAQQIIKDPYNFDFLTLRQEAQERELELALLNNIRKFLLELGVGFSFVGSQYRLAVGGDDFYIDLLFYHLKLRCYIVIDLKVGEFKPEYTGKLNFYLSAVDDLLRHPNDEPTIGLILCKTNKRIVAEYALRDVNKPMGVATYLTEALPDNLRQSLPDVESLEASLADISGDDEQ